MSGAPAAPPARERHRLGRGRLGRGADHRARPRARPLGVDLVDVSSAGLVPTAKVPVGPGYQTGFAERIRREAGVPTGAVGMITAPEQAEQVLRTGQADLVLLAREFLRDPYWPLHAAPCLHADADWPVQYVRARPPRD